VAVTARPVSMKAVPVIPPPPSSVSVRPVASVVAALVATPAPTPMAPAAEAPAVPAGEAPAPSTQRFRPAMASGAAAAIAAAVAAAKARQAEEERQQKEDQPEEEAIAPAIKATPLVVSALATTRVTPPPQPTASFKRVENGSSVFLTDDPLVVKRPAEAVMTQRMNAADSTAAVATPIPAPPAPTRLPGTRAIPPSSARAANGTAETKTATLAIAPLNESRRPSENLPMRRPPSEVYSKGRRRHSGTIFADTKQKKSFPWPIVGFVAVVGLAAAALVVFALSAPRLVNTPLLQPDKLTFNWKPGTPKPKEQILRLKNGAAASTFSAASSDDEWLSVKPDSDEPSNRSWQVRIDPEKVGPTGPNGTSGWIDVTSAEGFKTQEEVIVKVDAAEVTPAPAPKAKKPAVVVPNSTPLAPAAALKKPVAADKGTAAGNGIVTSAKTSGSATKPPAAKKAAANDVIDVN
jgi:hypothetical protein